MPATPQSDILAVPAAFRGATRERFCAAELVAPHRTEVAVVGAGVTGLSAALTLSQGGAGVTVLEARHVGAGASGRAFGQVVPVSKHAHHWLAERFGAQRSSEIVNLLASGPDAVFAVIEQHGIDCEATREGMLLAVHHRTQRDRVIETVDYWRSRGAPVELVGGAELAAVAGSSRYDLAMLDRRVGTVNGFGLAQGLARAAALSGAHIVEKCEVSSISKRGGHWILATPAGEVSAGTVVLATNAYSDSPWPALGRSILPVRGHGLVSAPLESGLRAEILPGGQSLMDTRRLFSGIRLRRDGRLHVSADGPPFRLGAADRRRARRRVESVFPQLEPVQWDEEWAGWIAMNPAQFPSLHRLDDRAWAALGYSGRGLALGFLLGREIGREIVGARNRSSPMPITTPSRIPPRFAAKLYARALISLYRTLDRRELRGIE